MKNWQNKQSRKVGVKRKSGIEPANGKIEYAVWIPFLEKMGWKKDEIKH